MIKEIVKDEAFLRVPSENADAEDIPALDDLRDTLRANEWRCVGMAGNMIGVRKRMIVFVENGKIEEMFNPVLLKRDGAYQTEEGCLSLIGKRTVKRYNSIKVRWQTRDMKPRIRTFSGFTAQIIQHEMDHLDGIVI
ncbi:MAG: peptide deformylase [Clostridia bacterium]|nr:peptide deformylase [Clostridia bacterium]